MNTRIAVLKKDLVKVLLLLETNEHTSASKSGLELRAENRKEALKILQHITQIPDKELNDIYWKNQL